MVHPRRPSSAVRATVNGEGEVEEREMLVHLVNSTVSGLVKETTDDAPRFRLRDFLLRRYTSLASRL